MKIAFWSEQEGAGTTFNMAAIVSAAVMLYPVSAAVIAGGYDDSDLENQFGFQEQTGNTWRSQEKAAEQTGTSCPDITRFRYRPKLFCISVAVAVAAIMAKPSLANFII